MKWWMLAGRLVGSWVLFFLFWGYVAVGVAVFLTYSPMPKPVVAAIVIVLCVLFAWSAIDLGRLSASWIREYRQRR